MLILVCALYHNCYNCQVFFPIVEKEILPDRCWLIHVIFLDEVMVDEYYIEDSNNSAV
jgi:hypothetical protein